MCKIIGEKRHNNKKPPPMVGEERAMRFELTTSSLARRCSTTELRPHII